MSSSIQTDLHVLQHSIAAALETQFAEPAFDVPADTVTFALAASVQVEGEDHATVTVCVDEVIGRSYAAVMFDLADDELTDTDIADSLLELTNVLGGAAKTSLPGQSHLTIPSIVALDGAVAVMPRGVVFKVAGGAVGVAVTEAATS